MDRFGVDLEELDAVMRRMTRCVGALDQLAADLDRQVAILHTEWTGLAADAQALAHAEWTRGLAAMTAALAALHQVAATAHDNYTRAAETNLAMWRSAT